MFIPRIRGVVSPSVSEKRDSPHTRGCIWKVACVHLSLHTQGIKKTFCGKNIFIMFSNCTTKLYVEFWGLIKYANAHYLLNVYYSTQ